MERQFTGLTDRLSAYLAAQFRLSRSKNAETCPGETSCIDGGRGWQVRRNARAELPVLSICEGDGDKIERCPLVFTKPGYVIPDIQRWAAVATRLSRLKEGGAAYAYPDGLTPAEWAAIDALQLARIENDSQDSDTRQTEVATDAAITRLEAAKRRR